MPSILRKKSHVWVWAVLLTALLVLAAGSLAGAAKKKVVKISVQMIYDPVPNIWNLIEQYNEENPDVEIVGLKGYSDTALVVQAQKKDMEIDAFFSTAFVDTARQVAQDMVQPWDKWLSEKEKKDIYPQVLAEGTIDGKIYGYGGLVEVTVLGYWKEMFKKIGADKPAETWDGLYQQAVKIQNALSKPGRKTYGVIFNFGANIWRHWQPMMMTLTDTPFGKDGYINWDSGAAVEALEILKKFNDGLVPPDAWLDDEAIAKTKLAAAYMKYAARVYLTRTMVGMDDYGVVPLPHAPGKKGGGLFWTTAWVLSKYGHNTKEAVDFITWLVHQPSYWPNMVLNYGGLAPFRSEYERIIKKASADQADWIRQNQLSLDVSSAIPPRPFYMNQASILHPMMVDYLRGTGKWGNATAADIIKTAKKNFYEEVSKQEKEFKSSN